MNEYITSSYAISKAMWCLWFKKNRSQGVTYRNDILQGLQKSDSEQERNEQMEYEEQHGTKI